MLDCTKSLAWGVASKGSELRGEFFAAWLQLSSWYGTEAARLSSAMGLGLERGPPLSSIRARLACAILGNWWRRQHLLCGRSFIIKCHSAEVYVSQQARDAWLWRTMILVDCFYVSDQLF